MLDDSRELILDTEGNPREYQVISVYSKEEKAGLVTSYREYIGKYSLEKILYVREGPMFTSEDYEVESRIFWIDYEGVYEGTIEKLYNSFALVSNVKMMLPINHKARVPYWKISKEDIKLEERLSMSTKANIILRNEVTIRREIVLYKHADAHPNNMILYLAEMLREAYIEFKELGDMDWFLDPSKLASFMVVKSVPQITEDVKSLMRQLPESARHQLESAYFLGMPHFLVENGRVSNCNYDYIITLSEDAESEEKFFGYELEINKMQHNKLVSNIMKHKENLLREKSKVSK